MINTEAVELINTLRKELGISCIIWCDKGESSCKTCPAWEALRKAENFLAKLEGGDVHVPDTSGS